MKLIINKFFIILFLSFSIFFSGCSDVSEGKLEIHHAFPQQFRNYFEKVGINIDDYGIPLTRDSHRGLESLHNSNGKEVWNAAWRNFIEKNPNASKRQIINKLEKMLLSRGYSGSITYINYLTKSASGYTDVITDNWFLNFAGVLGKWLINLLSGSDWGDYIIALLAYWGSEILAKFGIITGHPIAVGVGLIAALVLVAMLVGLFYYSIFWGIVALILLFFMLPTI